MEPNYTPPTEKIVEITKKNVLETVGMPPKFFIRLGSTDGKFFRRYGIPTLTYGPDASMMGKVNEYVSVSELVQTANVHLGVSWDFLNVQ
ncbi:MAG: hypothetical protein QXZ09_09650 [Candidatus Methanomethylicaceae archaeon]